MHPRSPLFRTILRIIGGSLGAVLWLMVVNTQPPSLSQSEREAIIQFHELLDSQSHHDSRVESPGQPVSNPDMTFRSHTHIVESGELDTYVTVEFNPCRTGNVDADDLGVITDVFRQARLHYRRVSSTHKDKAPGPLEVTLNSTPEAYAMLIGRGVQRIVQDSHLCDTPTYGIQRYGHPAPPGETQAA